MQGCESLRTQPSEKQMRRVRGRRGMRAQPAEVPVRAVQRHLININFYDVGARKKGAIENRNGICLQDMSTGYV